MIFVFGAHGAILVIFRSVNMHLNFLVKEEWKHNRGKPAFFSGYIAIRALSELTLM